MFCWAIRVRSGGALKWEPKVSFKELARMMTDADMKLAEQEKVWKDHKANKKE